MENVLLIWRNKNCHNRWFGNSQCVRVKWRQTSERASERVGGWVSVSGCFIRSGGIWSRAHSTAISRRHAHTIHITNISAARTTPSNPSHNSEQRHPHFSCSLQKRWRMQTSTRLPTFSSACDEAFQRVRCEACCWRTYMGCDVRPDLNGLLNGWRHFLVKSCLQGAATWNIC